MLSRSFNLLAIKGVDIKIDPSCLIIALLICWGISVRFFPSTFPDQSPVTYMSMAVFAVLGYFASLLLREIVRVVVAQRLGVHIGAITLFLFGGLPDLTQDPQSARNDTVIAIVGPAVSLALALAFAAFEIVATRLAIAEPVVQVIDALSTVNLILAAFTLLPAFPLDGGRVLRAVLWHRNGDLAKASEMTTRSGGLLAYALIGIGVLAIFNDYLVAGLWQIFLASFLLVAARANLLPETGRHAVSDPTVNAVMTPDPVTVSPNETLAQVVSRILLQDQLSFLPVVENGVLLGSIDSDLLGRIDRDNWTSTKVDDVFVKLTSMSRITPDTSIAALLDIIARTGQRNFLVTEGERLVGITTLADLTRYMTLIRQFSHR